MIDLMQDEAAYLELTLTNFTVAKLIKTDGALWDESAKAATFSLDLLGLVHVPDGSENSIRYNGKSYYIICRRKCVDATGYESFKARIIKYNDKQIFLQESFLLNFDVIKENPDAMFTFVDDPFDWVTAVIV